MRAARQISFGLKPIPPFRLDLTAWALRRRRENIVDRWDGSVYRRVVVIGDRPLEVGIIQNGSPEAPALEVTVRGSISSAVSEGALSAALERMLGLNLNLQEFYSFAGRHRRLAPLAERFRGLKPPRFPSVFEALTNGIACQQLSLTVGIILLNRLAEKFGASLAHSRDNSYSFALPEKIAKADVAALRALGYSVQKSRALIELAQKAVSEGPDLGGLYVMDDEAALSRLYQLRGVGRWTAEYVLLRGLGRIDIFPGDDVGARNNLQKLLQVEKLDYEGVNKIMKRWRPFGGFIYFHLLLEALAAQGFLEETVPKAERTVYRMKKVE